MPRHIGGSESDSEPLQDSTAALTLRTKRTERIRRKNATRQQKRDAAASLAKLPTELLLESLCHLEPSDVFHFACVNRRFRSVVEAHSHVIGATIIRRRYAILVQCFPSPKRLATIEPDLQALLTDPKRQAQLSIHKRPYQHIQSPDPHELCTCLTCIMFWNNLNLALDFACWQDHLDKGEPIPTIPRGQAPIWNVNLIARNARVVRKVIDSPLWHARLLQVHLDSTKRAILRHGQNKGNKRIHIAMTPTDAASATDSFLAKHGPASLEFPFQRDEYYILEAYIPNRWWIKSKGQWVYNVAGHHERDLEYVRSWARWRTMNE